jgi:phosphatidate phosphatase APP1
MQWALPRITLPVTILVMSQGSTGNRIYRGFRRALRVASRPVRRDRGLRGIVVQPYRGYGTATELYLRGRVFRQPRLGGGLLAGTVRRDVADILRRTVRWGLGRKEIVARFGGAEQRVTTDRDGYFEVPLRLTEPPPADRIWHDVELSLEHRGEIVREKGEVFVPPRSSRFVVISDIDDTVVLTGVANVAKMMYRLFVQGVESRVAFPGVAALYRALHRGASGDEQNPMLYVSRGPWSIYEMLEEFFHLHRIPVGPILFLREWGLTIQRPLPKRSRDHKLELIEGMLARYHDLPFILIGDSGQHDPEIYAQVVRDYPGRVLAVYIRNVSRRTSRRDEIDELARELDREGSPLILASDSFVMARHAAEEGFISTTDLGDVIAEKIEGDEPEMGTAVEVPPERVTEALEREAEGDEPPNVVAEPRRK